MFNDACIAHTQGYYGDYMDNDLWEVPASTLTSYLAIVHLLAYPATSHPTLQPHSDLWEVPASEIHGVVTFQKWRQKSSFMAPKIVI